MSAETKPTEVGPAGPYEGKSSEFHLKEYESLRREIELTLKDSR